MQDGHIETVGDSYEEMAHERGNRRRKKKLVRKLRKE